MKLFDASRTPVVVAAIALTFALAATALAGPDALTEKITKSKVRKIAKKQARRAIDSREPGLNVNSARTADEATSARTADDAAKLGGRGPESFAPSRVEPYHEVGGPGEPPFAPGWTNETPSTESTAGFYADPFGTVHLKGIVARSGGGDLIFTLPAAYRPAKIVCLPTVKANPTIAATYVCVFPTGAVSMESAAGLGSFLLDGLDFRAGAG